MSAFGDAQRGNQSSDKPIRLTYFGLKAKAQLPVIICEFAKLPYEFREINNDAWKDLKPTTPFGQLPLMEFYGTTMSQSLAIAHVLAKECQLLGNSPREFAVSEMLLQQMEDVWQKTTQSNPTSFKKTTPEGFEQFWSEYIPQQFLFLTKLLRGDRFTDNITLGELAVFNQLNLLLDIRDNLFENYPELQAFYKRIAAVPNIAAYINGEAGPKLKQYLAVPQEETPEPQQQQQQE